MQRSVIPSPAHRPGEVVHGFRVDAVTAIEDIRALCYEAVHEETGARVIHIHCHDEENLFSVGFATPPDASNGVAHILEHSVLAGSRRYPVKDAFNELGKRTLHTFLNAMTWPDRTVYPTCSAVRQDLRNLAAVYTDLVFHPLLTEETFRQEGHHLELADPDDLAGPLKITGVVYNEMQGVYGAPEAVVDRAMRRGLLPDTPYGFDSGGDPDVIPELTYERFGAFHRAHYTAGNARFLLYGDIPLAEHLRFLEGVVRDAPRGGPGPAIPPQPRWDAPRRDEVAIPIGAGDDPAHKSFVVVAWMANETADVAETVLMDVLCDALAGSAAGPVQRALIDSGLGHDLFPSYGYMSQMRHAVAAFGLRGTDPEHADRIEAIILETLERTAREGLPRALVEASFHQIEHQGKAIVPPFPVQLMARVNAPWYYGADPKAGLRFASLIEEARARYAAEPGLLEGRLRRWLLDNPHRLRLLARPSERLAEERAQALRARLDARKQGMTDEELRRIRDEAAALRAAQEAPEDPDALRTLPALDLDAIPRAPRVVPTAASELAGVPVLAHEVFSNGIGYIGLSFDASDLDDALAPYLPLLGAATLGLGAGGLDYAQTATRIATTVGALRADRMAGRSLRDGRPYERFAIDADVLARNAAPAADLLCDLLLRSDTSERDRLRDLVREAAARQRSRLVPSGHMLALLRAAAPHGRHHRRREQWDGVTQIALLHRLSAAIEGEVDALAERLAALQRRLFTRRRLLVSLAGDASVLEQLRPHIERLVRALPDGELPAEPGADAAEAPPLARATGIVAPSQVCFVGRVLAVPRFTEPAGPALDLLSEVLANDLLYKRLRLQGGAYGGFAMYMLEDGLLPLLSYRDPHLLRTLEVYDEVAAYARDIDDEAIEATRLGAIGAFDRPLAPGQQLAVARRRHLAGITDAARGAYREGLLRVDAAELRREAVPHLEAGLRAATTAVVASRERLEEANAHLAEPLDLVSIEDGAQGSG